MEKRIFVARESELAQLVGFLKQALAAEGSVCFVAGEAGSGKTALVTEFARRAQEQFKDLVVAVGQSDAQTGVGDAYLPFREVLGQLTGDVEPKLAQGAISAENASRLKKLLGFSGQVLVEVGPDLIDVFVPGAGLVARAGAFLAEKVGWLEKLEQLAGKKPEAAGAGKSGLDQSNIFEQYANVLGRLSEKRPLLLVLDDLHWADVASIGLLFRLGRRVGGHRILIVGTYRPEEVNIGRAGERHPLEKALAELKRYQGDIWVDLNQIEQAEGRHFVNSFLDSEPNRLGYGFRQKLLQHTGGHALFTIELLRAMQERGEIVQDESSRWVETPALDWESLPGKVEGVIEERIGRLERDLRQMLSVGSVEGEDFTAEILARVRAADVRVLVNRLSAELDRQHHLVSAQGVRRLQPQGQRLSVYRFQHNLFQKYLYNELDGAERAYLHEDIGSALEALYGDRVDDIVVQLARHFEEAQNADKARLYLARAGKQAAARFANDEAIAYYSRAVDLTPQDQLEERYALLLDREQVYNLLGERAPQAQDLAALEALAQSLGEVNKQAEVSLLRAKYALQTSDYAGTVAAADRAINQAETPQGISLQAASHLVWGIAALWQGDSETGRQHLEQARDLARQAELPQVEASSLNGLGAIADDRGDFDTALMDYEASLRISRAIGDRPGEAKTLNNLAVLFGNQGQWARATTSLEQCAAVFDKIGDRRSAGVLLGNLGYAYSRQGNLQAARNAFEQSRLTSKAVGDRENVSLQLGNLGGVYTSLGDLAAARQAREQALQLIRELGSQPTECLILNDLSYTLALQGDYRAAGEYGQQALDLARALGDQRREAKALGTLGFVHLLVGDYPAARQHCEACLQIVDGLGLLIEEGNARSHLGLLVHNLGENQAALEHCRRAVAIARETGEAENEATALNHLGHSLAGLGSLEEAAEAYRQSVAIWRSRGQHYRATEPLAGLAGVYAAKENPGEARILVEEILRYRSDGAFAGVEEPIRVEFTCYRVLAASGDPRARELLAASHRLLEARAAEISDEELRRCYLEAVPAHRQVMEAWLEVEARES